jgi:hypothetical protein
MKKFLAYFTTVLFVGFISLSVLASSDDDPKKQQTDTTTVVKTEKQKDAATVTPETKACCKDAGKTASGTCPKAAECKSHKKCTAEVK